MGWLLGYTLGSAALAFITVRIFDAITGVVVDTPARAGVFITSWAGFTASQGMRGVRKTASNLRLRNGSMKKHTDVLTKGKGSK